MLPGPLLASRSSYPDCIYVEDANSVCFTTRSRWELAVINSNLHDARVEFPKVLPNTPSSSENNRIAISDYNLWTRENFEEGNKNREYNENSFIDVVIIYNISSLYLVEQGL